MKLGQILIIILLLSSCKTKTPEISKIEFKADACFGTCPVFTIIILKDGTADYDASIYNKLQGRYRTIIKKASLDSLRKLIYQANLLELKDNYSTLSTDHTTYTLKVSYINGKTKKIKDYGPSGPDELEKIYSLIFSLRETQNWK